MTFNSLDDLYNTFKWKSPSKFIPLATKHGFSASDARAFLKHNVEHDIIPKKPSFMHIYSKTGHAYQMDTLINTTRKKHDLEDSQTKINYLILININTRKAYAYELHGKNSNTVLEALQHFISDEPHCESITSDQDPAYLTEQILTFMKQHHIVYRTTEDNNHNILGIINRFIRTVRDYIGENRMIQPSEMKLLIETYNETPHKGIGNKTPNEMDADDEQEYVRTMKSVNPYKFNNGDIVKVINVKSPFEKHRTNVTKEAYIIDSRAGNQYIIRSKDDSVDKYPGYRLVKAPASSKNNLAETIKGGKRGIVEKIVGYEPKSDKYNIVYEGGVKDSIKAKNLREGNPTQLSDLERRYWSTRMDSIPESIKKWI